METDLNISEDWESFYDIELFFERVRQYRPRKAQFTFENNPIIIILKMISDEIKKLDYQKRYGLFFSHQYYLSLWRVNQGADFTDEQYALQYMMLLLNMHRAALEETTVLNSVVSRIDRQKLVSKTSENRRNERTKENMKTSFSKNSTST